MNFFWSSIVERSVVGLLRLAIRLLHEEEVSSQVLLTLRILLLMKQNVLQACGRQISFGLCELIQTNASSITSTRDWVTVFTLLECVGAAATPPTVTSGSVAMASISKDMHILIIILVEWLMKYLQQVLKNVLLKKRLQNDIQNGK